MRGVFFYSCLFFHVVVGYQIRHLNTPECRKCVYFEPERFFSSQDAIRYGTCLYYGEKNIIDGSIKHELASIARKYNDCGENGTRYIEDPDYALKLRSRFLYNVLKRKNNFTESNKNAYGLHQN